MTLDFQPLVPFAVAALAALCGLVIVKLRARGVFWLVLAALLAGPTVIRETRKGVPDKLIVVVDDSPSMNLGKRSIAAGEALDHVLAEAKKLPNLEPVVLRAGGADKQETDLFAALADAPRRNVAGVVMITDGQVHDVPASLGIGPLQTVLVGKKDALDHRIEITSAPKYGLLGQQVTIKYRVDGGAEQSETHTLDHPGQNVFEFSTPVEEGELTAANNKAAAVVGAVRDRLKVLLVSGAPHMGERAWRDLLKSDPAVDLVHFTILRSPNSMSNVPANELALIAFPVEELFARKIKDFDLIIFDKYSQYDLLEPRYFDNIASYVKGGGAFLVSLDSDRVEQALFATSIGPLLPVTPRPPEQSVIAEEFLPKLTEAGKAHPVTADLDGKKWGKWQTQISLAAAPGAETLMTGAEGDPLLVLGKAGEGRVGVLASDNIWMWSKGMDGGGPYTELLRNTAHWLMKEPELEDDFIRASVKEGKLTVETRKAGAVTLTRPDGKAETLSPAAGQKGWFAAEAAADMSGLYKFDNGKTAYVAVGAETGKEFSDVRTTDEKLKGLGGIVWYESHPDFPLDIKPKGDYRVEGTARAPLLPGWAVLLVILAGLIAVWKLEAGKLTRKD